MDPVAHAYLFAFPAGGELLALDREAEIEVAGRKLPRWQVFTHEKFTGDHEPIGIFLAAGGPVAHRADRDRISVLDIAPLIHYLAGDRIPDDLEGSVPQRWIAAEQLSARPVVLAPAAEFPFARGEPSSAEAAASHELTEKLRALGYVQ